MQEAMWGAVAEEVRRRTERLVNGMMEAERMMFLRVAPYERNAARRGRRNGFDERVLDSWWGPLKLRIPKVRQSAERFRLRTLGAYQRRQKALDQLALEWVACGMSTRAVSEQLYRAFGALVSAGTISALVAELDAELATFRARRFERGYRHVFLDGKHGKVAEPSGRRGRGRMREGVLLLAWGIRHDGSEELIDFRVARDESEGSWDGFLRDLRERGLVEVNRWQERLETIISDGDAGLAAALALNYPETPHQTCVFHKVKNLLDDLQEKSHKGAIQGEAGAIFDAATRAEALARAEAWRRRWERAEPLAVAHFWRDLETMLLFYNASSALRRRVKTTNPLERFILELDRKFERIGVFPHARSWERITFLAYRQLVARGYAPIRHRVAFTRTS
jgi:transposase-like protein